MKQKAIRLVFAFLMLVLASGAWADYNNAVSASISPFFAPGFATYHGIGYERTVFRLPRGELLLRAEYFQFFLWEVIGEGVTFDGIALLGRRNSKLEIVAGGMVINDKGSWVPFVPSDTNYFSVAPNFALGYRYRREGKRWDFRTGISFPLPFLLYASVGYRF